MLPLVVPVGDIAQWSERRSMTGELYLVCTGHTSTADDSALRYSPLLTIIAVPLTMYDSSGFKYALSMWLKIGSTT